MSQRYLKFSLAAAMPLIDHAEAAPACGVTFSDRMNPTLWHFDAVPKNGLVKVEEVDTRKLKPYLYLVKDEGVYIMSGGVPAQMVFARQPKRMVVYAEGLNPAQNDWYDQSVKLCGGDDMAEAIHTEDIRSMMRDAPGAQWVCVKFQKNKFQVWVE